MLKMLNVSKHLSKLAIASAMTATLGLALFQAPVAQAATTKCDAKDVKCVIAFGDKEITNRENALNTLNTKISDVLSKKHITDTQATNLTADVKNHLTILTNLKTRLDAETTAKAAREDVKDMYQHRIFAVVVPRDYRILHLDAEIAVRDKLVDVKPNVESLIDKASAAQKAKLNPLFSDYKSDLSSIEGKIDTVQTTLPKLTAEAFNTQRATYTTNKTNVEQTERLIHTNLQKATKDLHQIRQILDIK
ncbi:hypothetical protein KDW_27800 [Dictyobacter vulcani]|uniref:Uncharacterized protein n=1 Tax=Dictyobacter vulcani TaxID=2607529 RepID=A0A5J4KGA5_9CHLR|nr:hypothetical protein [Dictyobacter vulcani]GER88618.1 hypothetical protein KDW_27800 [Dictyobacter vulcani]